MPSRKRQQYEMRDSLFDAAYKPITRPQLAKLLRLFRKHGCANKITSGWQLLQKFDYALVRKRRA